MILRERVGYGRGGAGFVGKVAVVEGWFGLVFGGDEVRVRFADRSGNCGTQGIGGIGDENRRRRNANERETEEAFRAHAGR